MIPRTRFATLCFAFSLFACSSAKEGTDILDAGSKADTGPSDSGVAPDSGTPADSGAPDSGTPADSGAPDSGTPDTGTPDTGTPDSGTPDTSTPDTSTPDSGTPDTGTPDTSTPDSGVDCNGVPGGSATEDMCGTCDDDPSNDCVQDCAGTWGGTAVEDNCGTCDADPANDCVQDCAGTWGGTAAEDMCGTCDSDPANDCVQDCAGTWGGLAAVDDCGTCDDDANNDCVFNYYVDAAGGLDTNSGARNAPFKTISHAVSVATSSQRIKVWPGVYDATNGETFPITVPPGVVLWGDSTTRGDGPPATLIAGDGSAGTYFAALVLSDNCEVTGFRLEANSTVRHFGVYASEVTGASVQECSFMAGYGGVKPNGTTDLQITDNTFDTGSYGVYANSVNGSLLIEGNEFLSGPNLPIDLGGANTSIVRNNVILGSGQVGIQIQGGSPELLNNVFTHTSGYTYGCFHAGGTPIIRGSTCPTGSTRGIWVRTSGQADMGTVNDPGNNVFSGTGPAIEHENSNTVSAIGNTYVNNPPVCGTDIAISGGGVVIWGPGSNDHCP